MARKVHLFVPSQFVAPGVSACGLYFATEVITTTDREAVTCASCIREMAELEKAR